MEKKKRKQHKEHGTEQSPHYGNVHIQGEGRARASEQERKKEQQPSTRKKRKRDKTGARSKQVTADTKEIACTADCVGNEEEQHVINGDMEQKTRRNMGDFSLHHVIGMCAQTQEKKKKKRNDNQGEQYLFCPNCAKAPTHLTDEDDMLFNFSMQPDDRFCPDHAKASMHLSDEDDMLFNFSTQPDATIVDNHKKPQANIDRREQKTEIFSAKDEILRSKKKKNKKKDEGEHYSHNYNESTPHTEENDVVSNFVTQPQPAVENTVDYKSPTMTANQHANGSFREKKKLQNDAFIEQEHLKVKEKKEMTLVDTKTDGIPEENISRPTFSIAVAGSIVDNAQSLELATMLAGQIARAAVIFRVDEIVVFDDYDGKTTFNHQAALQEDNSEEVGGLFMVRILKYLEVPQYLRRALIPMHRSLSSVGKLPPLDAPHHLRKHEWQPFREGVVLDNGSLSGSGSCVDVGLEKDVVVDKKLKPGTRVTVAMGHTRADGDALQVVDRETVRQAGFYWGYSVRYACCLSAVFDECPFEGKYDFCIGTSEHGEKLEPTDLVLPNCKHLLVAFGGLSGLEESVELDKRLQKRNVTSLFHRYINTCSNQGSRTIRTEEAILISLQFLQAAVQQALLAP